MRFNHQHGPFFRPAHRLEISVGRCHNPQLFLGQCLFEPGADDLFEIRGTSVHDSHYLLPC